MPNNGASTNQKTPINRRLFDMDPGRLALPSLRVKGSMLLYAIRAQVHNIILKQKEPFGKSPSCLTRRWLVSLRSPTVFALYQTKIACQGVWSKV